eukprot:3979277-Amphidinium_carterae.1
MSHCEKEVGKPFPAGGAKLSRRPSGPSQHPQVELLSGKLLCETLSEESVRYIVLKQSVPHSNAPTGVLP